MRNLGLFKADYDRGKPKFLQILWFLSSNGIFNTFLMPSAVRIWAINFFGGQISRNVLIRHSVVIQWPWKLSIGENSWIGEGTRILTLENVTIGSNVCISQEVLICTGSHDHKQISFPYKNKPIVIHDGAWLAARCTILAGVTVGQNSVVAAGEILRFNLPDNSIFLGGQIRPIPVPK